MKKKMEENMDENNAHDQFVQCTGQNERMRRKQ